MGCIPVGGGALLEEGADGFLGIAGVEEGAILVAASAAEFFRSSATATFTSFSSAESKPTSASNRP